MTRSLILLSIVLFACSSCSPFESSNNSGQQALPTFAKGPDGPKTLKQARDGFKTKLTRTGEKYGAPDQPDGKSFNLTKYKSSAGQLHAYITPDPKDGEKRPAVIWITGGDCNSIGNIWEAGSSDNDQTASPLQKAGFIMMYPSLRGGNDNPGRREGYLGEVDDVLAARKHLAALPYVDSDRIYLGGHSTGGTLALLVSEYSNAFRAVFSLGPIGNVAGYGQDYNYCSIDDEKEIGMRSPIYWLHGIKSPTFVFEGTDGSSNIESLQAMSAASSNENTVFLEVSGHDHFSVIWPLCNLLVDKIKADTGKVSNIKISASEMTALGN
ncbi:MAG: prolyl oligopeptidase family serine peptidase [Planctomycetota bacterium]